MQGSWSDRFLGLTRGDFESSESDHFPLAHAPMDGIAKCKPSVRFSYAKRRDYRLYEQKAMAEEVDRKAEWRGLKRMHCLIEAFADGKVSGAEVDTCKKKTVDMRSLA